MKSLLIFLGGAAVGGLAGWLVTKHVYTKKVAEVRNIYADLTAEAQKDAVKAKEEAKQMQKDAADYVVNSLGYSAEPTSNTAVGCWSTESVSIPGYWEKEGDTNSSAASITETVDEAPIETPDNEPYFIAEGRFEGDPKYQKHYLVYSVENDELYEGGDDAVFTVYDRYGEPEDLSTTDILGTEFLEEAMDYTGNAADICHIRNETLQMDFEVEILR